MEGGRRVSERILLPVQQHHGTKSCPLYWLQKPQPARTNKGLGAGRGGGVAHRWSKGRDCAGLEGIGCPR